MDNQTTAQAIQRAIGAHGAWKTKFRAAARTGHLPATVQTIAADDQCEFGRLLKALAPDLQDDADFAAIRRMHADFHMRAGRLAQHIVAGDADRVNFELGKDGAFETCSHALSARLADWRIKLKYQGEPPAMPATMPASRPAAMPALSRSHARS